MGSLLRSIVTEDLETCIICGKPAERHHIFGGSNRRNSTVDGLILPLCPEHHREGVNAVHNNADMNRLAHIIGEMAWIKANELPFETATGAQERFRARYGKNYL